MVPRDLHLGDEEFDSLKVGDRIKVEIQKSRFQLRDPFIVSVGIYRGLSGAPTRIVNLPKNEIVEAKEEELLEEDANISGDEAEEESGAEEEEEEEAKEE
jgi:hypothetical protein